VGTRIERVDILKSINLVYEKLDILSDNNVSDLTFIPVIESDIQIIINDADYLRYNTDFTFSGSTITLIPSEIGYNITNIDQDEVYAKYYKS